MADGCGPLLPDVRHTFLVEAHAETDVLLRVLNPFAIQGARIVAAELSERAGQVAIRIEVIGMAMARAELVMSRLRGLPSVLAVGLAWRKEALPLKEVA